MIDRQVAEDSIQQKAAVYDGTGDEHYDTISTMIKSVRGSDPDAAVYWMARMLEAGEDPPFIARRLAILASEDIGNANPRGIMVAAACWELVEREWACPSAGSSSASALLPRPRPQEQRQLPRHRRGDGRRQIRTHRRRATGNQGRQRSQGLRHVGEKAPHAAARSTSTPTAWTPSPAWAASPARTTWAWTSSTTTTELGAEKMFKERLDALRAAQRGEKK